MDCLNPFNKIKLIYFNVQQKKQVCRYYSSNMMRFNIQKTHSTAKYLFHVKIKKTSI